MRNAVFRPAAQPPVHPNTARTAMQERPSDTTKQAIREWRNGHFARPKRRGQGREAAVWGSFRLRLSPFCGSNHCTVTPLIAPMHTGTATYDCTHENAAYAALAAEYCAEALLTRAFVIKIPNACQWHRPAATSRTAQAKQPVRKCLNFILCDSLLVGSKQRGEPHRLTVPLFCGKSRRTPLIFL